MKSFLVTGVFGFLLLYSFPTKSIVWEHFEQDQLDSIGFFHVFLDLKICQQANWNLLNQFLTFPAEKRDWFNFIVFGSEADISARDYVLMYKHVVHFESKVINGKIFKKILTLINNAE